MPQVVMASERYGNEYFKYETLDDALAGIKRLWEKVEAEQDGVGRVIGLVFGAPDAHVVVDEEEGESDGAA